MAAQDITMKGEQLLLVAVEQSTEVENDYKSCLHETRMAKGTIDDNAKDGGESFLTGTLLKNHER